MPIAHLRLPTRRHRQRPTDLRAPSPAPTSTGASARCCSTPSPRWPSRPRSPSPTNCNTAPSTPTSSAPPHVERARYHAELARRRYLAVDPGQPARRRHPRSRLEHRAARTRRRRTGRPNKPAKHHNQQLSDAQRARIAQLVTDLPSIWNDPATPARERKRIVRLLLTDVTVHRDGDTISTHVRFPAGGHTTLHIPVPKPAYEQRRTPANVLAAIDELLDTNTSGEIADILNRRGMTTGTGEAFHRLIVDNIIRAYRIRTRRQRLRDTGLWTPAELADAYGVSPQTIKYWRHKEIVRGHRYNDKGECLFDPPDPDNPIQRPATGRPPRR